MFFLLLREFFRIETQIGSITEWLMGRGVCRKNEKSLENICESDVERGKAT